MGNKNYLRGFKHGAGLVAIAFLIGKLLVNLVGQSTLVKIVWAPIVIILGIIEVWILHEWYSQMS